MQIVLKLFIPETVLDVMGNKKANNRPKIVKLDLNAFNIVTC